MSFEIFYDSQALRFLKKLDKAMALRIMDKLEKDFAMAVVPSGAKPVVGEHGVFRLRILGIIVLCIV